MRLRVDDDAASLKRVVSGELAALGDASPRR